jgi:hypothetical protein
MAGVVMKPLPSCSGSNQLVPEIQFA